MSDDNGPWGDDGEEPPSGFPTGLALWVALLALVSSGLVFARQIKLGEVVRNISIWMGLAAIVLVGYSFRTELEQLYHRVSGELVPSNAIALSDDELVINANADGHFYINGRANGERIRFLIDTGASGVTLSPQDASRIGIDLQRLQFTQRFQTANGIGYGAAYRLDSLSIGAFDFADMDISINGADMSTWTPAITLIFGLWSRFNCETAWHALLSASFIGASARLLWFPVVSADFGRTHPMALCRSWKIRRSKL